MEIVEAIRSKAKIDLMKKIMKGSNDTRALLLFTLGINTGLRISDILKLQWKHLMTPQGLVSPTDRITIREQKNKRTRTLILNKNVVKVIQEYYQESDPSPDEYLFKSRKGENKPITRNHAWYILKNYAQEAGVSQNIGTHTLRKTFGYQARMSGYPIEFIQKVFGHRNTEETLAYIGINQDELDELYSSLNL